MKNIQTLKNKKEFDFVYKNSKKYRSNICDICILQKDSIDGFYNKFKKAEKTHKIGLSVSKKIGKAVRRNLIKRRLRAICQIILKDYKEMEYIFIIIAKNNIAEIPFLELKEQIGSKLTNKSNEA